MAEKLTIDTLLPHLPANAKQLQQRFPAFPMDLITRLLKAGENTGVCQWDSLSNRWVLRPATEGKARKCMVCGDKYVPTSNAQKHCDRHAERRWKDESAPAPEPKRPVTEKPRQCEECGTEFVPTGNRQKFCPEHAWRKSGKSGEQLPDNQPQVPELPPQVPVDSNTQPAPSVSSDGYPSLEVAPRRGLLCKVGLRDGDPCLVIHRYGSDEDIIELDILEAATVASWLDDVLKIWRQRAATGA